MLSRREFLNKSCVLGSTALFLPGMVRGSVEEDMVMTVLGPVRAAELKFTLSHEHILVDFIGADKVSSDRYRGEEVFERAFPVLSDLRTRGCTTFVDCTPAYLGRDALLLQRLSKASGLHIITNTGYYGAAGEKYLPRHAYTETAEQLASRWITEAGGMDGTGVRPGFIKTGVDKGPLSAVQRKIIDAAALTHLATGLTIGVHTGNGEAAKEQLDILKSRGVAASARIWIHAQNEANTIYAIDAANAGSWISYDGVSTDSHATHIEFLKVMKSKNLLDRVLVSHDSGWYHAGEPNGGTYNDYNYIFTHFIPGMKREGFTDEDVNTLFVRNPSKAFTIAVRKL